MTSPKEIIADRYRDLVEHSHDFICTHDLKGKLLSVNETAARFLGYKVDELVGMQYQDLVVPEHRDEFQDYLREVTTRGSARGLVQVQTRSGARRIWQYMNTLRTDGVSTPIVRGMAHDITELWRVQHELRAQHSLLNAVMESTTDAIFVKDLAGRYLMINTAGARFLGQTVAGVIGKDDTEFFTLEDAARTLDRDRQIVATGEPVSYEEPLTAGGVTRFYSVSKAPYRDLKGNKIGIVGIARDATSRILAESALRTSEEALRNSNQQIRDLAGKLIAAQEEERRRISRELHDDLNQKLAATAIAISKIKRSLPEVEAPVAEQVAALQDRITSLSDDVRRLSHELHPASLEHLGLIGALQAHCSEFQNREGIKVRLAIKNGAGPVPQEVSLCLYRVTQEALRNIAKHSGAKGARVSLAIRPTSIELSVADSGIGFDQGETRQRSGLGLVSMTERVQLLGGTLRVQSKPGKGTKVVARISLGSVSDDEALIDGANR
jgi:PAS domain S-box-containing protein